MGTDGTVTTSEVWDRTMRDGHLLCRRGVHKPRRQDHGVDPDHSEEPSISGDVRHPGARPSQGHRRSHAHQTPARQSMEVSEDLGEETGLKRGCCYRIKT